MTLLRNANFIKSKLIDYVLKTNPNSLIGSELQFASNRGFADLVVVMDNSIVGYEIKAAGDDFRSLKKQLLLYKSVFDYVFVVVTEKHIISAKNLITGKSGLIFINSDGDIEIILKAKLIKSNKKKELLYSMTINFFKEYFCLNKKMTSLETRTILMKNSLKEIKSAYYDYLKERLYPKNKIFLSELGEKTHFEDVSLLSFSENAEFLY